MRRNAIVLTLLLIGSVATASADLASPDQRGQSNTRPASPRGRPAPPPPAPPPAPPAATQPNVTPPFVTPQPPAPFVPTPQPQTRTPFDATSRTYAPRYDNRPRRRYGPPYYSSAYGIGELVTGSGSAAVPEDVAASDFQGPPLTAPFYEPPRVVVASRGPDTYYVIPGCYAGNRPPNPERLPKGCDAAKLKTTPVR